MVANLLPNLQGDRVNHEQASTALDDVTSLFSLVAWLALLYNPVVRLVEADHSARSKVSSLMGVSIYDSVSELSRLDCPSHIAF